MVLQGDQQFSERDSVNSAPRQSVADCAEEFGLSDKKLVRVTV